MQKAGVPPNSITIATILSACAEISTLRSGREIHARAIRGLMDGSILVGNGLVNMYTKSGSLQVGRLVFDRIRMKDLISWNSIIAGYVMHGLCDEALSTFDDLIRAGFEPDRISFLAVLSACNHVGRVAEGRCLFDRMIHEYKLIPSMEHYTCMVDLLGRAGLLYEASELMRRMPMKPNTCVWGALLYSCRIHGNTAIAEDILRDIGDLEEQSTGNYILLSNFYAACGRYGVQQRMMLGSMFLKYWLGRLLMCSVGVMCVDFGRLELDSDSGFEVVYVVLGKEAELHGSMARLCKSWLGL